MAKYLTPSFKALTAAGSMVLFGITSGRAQEPAAPPPAPAAGQRFLRLLPLGEPPPFRQEIRDGIRFELEPEPGTVPPRQVVLGEGETAVTLRLNLGRTTDRTKVPAGTAPVGLRVAGGSPAEPPVPWLSLRPPESGDLLALVWRDPGNTWAKPRAIILPDAAAEFPAGRIRIINLLPLEAALIFGEDRVMLGAGKSLIRAMTIGADTTIQIAYRDPAGNLKRFYSGSVLLNVNERAQVVLYRADGENPRRPAKVVIFNELTPATPPAKPAP